MLGGRLQVAVSIHLPLTDTQTSSCWYKWAPCYREDMCLIKKEGNLLWLITAYPSDLHRVVLCCFVMMMTIIWTQICLTHFCCWHFCKMCTIVLFVKQLHIYTLWATCPNPGYGHWLVLAALASLATGKVLHLSSFCHIENYIFPSFDFERLDF